MLGFINSTIRGKKLSYKDVLYLDVKSGNSFKK